MIWITGANKLDALSNNVFLAYILHVQTSVCVHLCMCGCVCVAVCMYLCVCFLHFALAPSTQRHIFCVACVPTSKGETFFVHLSFQPLSTFSWTLLWEFVDAININYIVSIGKSNSYSAAYAIFVVSAVACVTSQQIGQRYNGTWLSYVDHNTQQNSAHIHLHSLTVA